MKISVVLLLLTVTLSQLIYAQSADPNLLSNAGGSTSFAPLAGDPANAACCSALQTSSEAAMLTSVNNCRTPNCGRLRNNSFDPSAPVSRPATAPTAN